MGSGHAFERFVVGGGRFSTIGASVDATPTSEFDDAGTTRQERIFQTIAQLLSDPPLVADVRAVLFRALPTIQGASAKQDAIDAAGRKVVDKPGEQR
ncbi:hypothetical protein ACQP2T_58155 [Nonomuraea sp. CA-143628]|uniref:hypothetical protein n=1 Tax=Nonomuraea sp. CA-143628 TaxID=3239997 RepID=UPI003D8E60C8